MKEEEEEEELLPPSQQQPQYQQSFLGFNDSTGEEKGEGGWHGAGGGLTLTLIKLKMGEELILQLVTCVVGFRVDFSLKLF